MSQTVFLVYLLFCLDSSFDSCLVGWGCSLHQGVPHSLILLFVPLGFFFFLLWLTLTLNRFVWMVLQPPWGCATHWHCPCSLLWQCSLHEGVPHTVIVLVHYYDSAASMRVCHTLSLSLFLFIIMTVQPPWGCATHCHCSCSCSLLWQCSLLQCALNWTVLYLIQLSLCMIDYFMDRL